MKKILLSALLILPVSLNAANDDDDKKKGFFEDAYLGFSYSPTLYFWNDKAPASNTSFVYNSKYSQGFGFELVKPVSDKILMNFGLQYNIIGFLRTEICNTCGEVDYTPEVISKSRYLSVPISANFMIKNDRLDIIGIFGIENSFLRGVNSDRLEYNGTHSKYTSKTGYSTWLFGINAGFGFNYTINHHFSYGMSILYRQPITQIAFDPAVSAFGVGINTGFFYKF